MDSRETFEEAIRLREQILETKLNAGGPTNSGGLTRKKNFPKVPMVLAGNKCDKEMRTVLPDEAKSYCAGQECCTFVETSAKKNLRVDDVFYELFLIANLPLEMAPNHHKRVNANFGSPCPLPPHNQSHHPKKYTLSVKRRLSDACGVVTPNVRRPSIRTDLMIMRAKTCSLGDNGGNVSNSGANWRSLEYRCILHGPRMNMTQINGNNRRPANINRIPPVERPISSQHDDLIKFIYDSWNKVSQEVEKSIGNTAIYYREQEPTMLKDFEPFDLEAYWGRRIVQNIQHS